MGLELSFGGGSWWPWVRWSGVAWALIGMEDRDGSLMRIDVAWRIKWVFVLFVGEDRVGLWWRLWHIGGGIW